MEMRTHCIRCGERCLISSPTLQAQDLLALVRFDFHLRPFVSRKLGIPVEEMSFYFGRPLAETIEDYGLRVIRERDGGFFLTKAGEKRNNLNA